jgi:hypothetical protein
MTDKKLLITGLVIPVNWDNHGRAIQLAITTDSFEKYIVADNSLGKELLGFVNDVVKVEGVSFEKDLFGNNLIHVHKFKRLKKGKLN